MELVYTRPRSTRRVGLACICVCVGISLCNGRQITDQDEILKRIEEFHEQPHDSDTQTEEPEKIKRTHTKCNRLGGEVYAVNYMARGKAPRPNNILIDTIKDGNNVINQELAKLFSACLQRWKVP